MRGETFPRSLLVGAPSIAALAGDALGGWPTRAPPRGGVRLELEPVPAYANEGSRKFAMLLADRIEMRPEVMLGKPVIRGTRIPASRVSRG